MGGLKNLIGEEKVEILQSTGMHKLAAALENNASGSDFEEIDIEAAAYLLGKKAYEKRASLRKIGSGLAAFKRMG